MKDFSNIKLVEDLPIAKFEEEIAEKLMKNSNLIVIGETGSGKTTQIPLIMLKNLSTIQNLAKGKIAITEPRRLAATSVSRYVASLVGDEIGKTVGYKIRFEESKSDETNLVFMTDGILLREAQLDPLLMEYSVVMVDEAHERNINSDFLIGLLVDTQKKRREKGLIPLKILVTSATLEKEKFMKFFEKLEGEPFDNVEVPGRLFPIQSNYEKRDVFDYEGRTAEIVQQIARNNLKAESKPVLGQVDNKGDILVFMPGKGEIERTKKAIEELKDFNDLNIEIITIHADLPMEEQYRIFKESPKRKVVIATNIAETSLTVPGVVYVIDSGLIKTMEFDPHTGINTLITKPHAKKGLEQRKGRAGRIEPGVYYGLYTEKSLNMRPEFPTPEILRTSLSQIVLVMKILGIQDIRTFNFIDHPDNKLIEVAIRELTRLGALDNLEDITEKGKTMASLPLEPRLANLIIEADRNKCVQTICTIAAFLEMKPVVLNLTQTDIFKQLAEAKSKSNNETVKIEDLSKEIELESKIGEVEETPVQIELTEQEVNELEIEAERIFAQYERKVRGLQYKGSDFFTLLKIFNLWRDAEMQPDWAHHNFLSVETLDEATNIREELLEIASENGIEATDKGGPDLNSRVEKTLIYAFKFNLLGIQMNNFYRNLRTGDKGIRIHNSSVLREDKPRFALAFEVIEIFDIDSRPKLSAKFLHEIDEKKMRQYFPDILKKENDFERKERRNSFRSRNRSFKFDRNKKGRRR